MLKETFDLEKKISAGAGADPTSLRAVGEDGLIPQLIRVLSTRFRCPSNRGYRSLIRFHCRRIDYVIYISASCK